MVTDRLPADPVARDALLRALRPQRLHPLPRLQGRRHQGATSCATTRRSPTTSCSPAAARRSSCWRRDIDDWRISFVDTGLHATLGERLLRRRPHLEDDEVFLANYGDVLTDAPLDELVDDFSGSDAIAAFLAVRADQLLVPRRPDDGRAAGSAGLDDVRRRRPLDQRRLLHLAPGDLRLHPAGEELVVEPFARLVAADRLIAYRTRASGRRWTRSRTCNPRGAVGGRPRRRGPCGCPRRRR